MKSTASASELKPSQSEQGFGFDAAVLEERVGPRADCAPSYEFCRCGLARRWRRRRGSRKRGLEEAIQRTEPVAQRGEDREGKPRDQHTGEHHHDFHGMCVNGARQRDVGNQRPAKAGERQPSPHSQG